MPRQLRSRASRPNYAALFHFDDGDDAGPSNAAPIFDEVDSGSDFAPAAEEQAGGNDDDLNDDVDEERKQASHHLSDSEREGSVLAVSASTGRRKSGVSDSKNKKTVSLAPGLPYSSTRQMYTLPSLHHRHRAVPIFDRPGPVERLAKCPAPFEPASTIPTNSWSHNAAVSERISKAWGFNVGSGPLWELMEDRAWFKESMQHGGEESTDEKSRRPRAHESVKAQEFQIISAQMKRGFSYLPTDINMTDEGTFKPPPPVPCSFGPYGKQTRKELKMFDSLRVGEFIPTSNSQVFNPGAPVWGIDWCPIHPNDRVHYSHKQYLAVAPFPTRVHSPSIGVRAQRPAQACIQIWSLRPSQDAMNAGSVTGEDGDPGEMRCEMVLCIDSGPAYELKWCPLPSNDPVQMSESAHDESFIRKLGVLAGTFEDGSLSLFVVPDPISVIAAFGITQEASNPVYVKLHQPLIRIELEETLCWALDWANSEVIAIGCTNGSIAVYNLEQALQSAKPANTNILPTYYLSIHQSAIRTLAWVRAPVVSAKGERTADHPTVIASGGYDGVECLTDLRELVGNMMNRTRDVVHSLCYSTYCGGPVTIDHENIIKAYSVSPSMLGRGHTLLEPDGPAWSVNASDYHPQLAIGVTDGSCLTTNMLRSTRRGGSVPFLVHKVYQLDYSRKDGEWRMLEKFLPKEMFDRPTAARSNKVLPVGTGAWPREVAIHRVVWNSGNGLAAAPYLVSATGSGLCRVDWLLGRWMRIVFRIMGYKVSGQRRTLGM